MFKRKDYKEKQLRYSIRKVSFGAASVAIASLYLFMGSSAVSASEVQPVNGEQNTVTNTEEVKKNEKQTEETDIKKGETLDKTSLTKLIEEIDGKFTNGKYTSKTEDSVNQLKAALEAAKTALSTAKTQAELTQAHANLIVATTKLQTKALDKKEAPVVDTTNGKATVGIKATNTEKASESNSIANSGSKDERNGKEMDKNNPLRTDAATTDTDPAANQTYTAPAADANLEKLSKKLKELPDYIENNKKIQDMDTLGNALKVEKGSVTEINEFGGWKAVGDSGKFAIARKTEAGVFPIETINTVWQAQSKTYQTWVLEQSFNRDSDYMLFLSKVRTKANSTEEAFDNSEYKPTDEGPKIAKGVKGFNGIQKTFKAYSKEHGSKVIVSFKTGYTGDIDGAKAQYKVEVIVNRNGHEEKLYDQTFKPEEARNNTEMTVVKASDGTNRPQNFITPGTTTPTKEELEAKIANNKPNGAGGTFTSKEITLPEGVTEYTVRISSADNQHLGMGYQSPYRHYALPVTGLDFNIDQDTGAIAKDLLSRIYEKLKATETADIDGKTNETKAAYLAELENIKTLVTSTDVKKTAEYKTALESILSKQLALEVDKTGLTDSKTSLDDLVKEDPTPGKTKDTATAYNEAKQEAIKAIETAKTVIAKTDATVAQVREALATVNAKKAALQQAKDGLIEAATAEEKAKLKADAAQLTKADETGKTPDSIATYEAAYGKLKTQLEEAKSAAAAVEAKGDNASKTEAQEAQAKVDAAKTALDKAAESLVNKADKAELKTAKEALNTLATEADPTTGKTADSAKAYNDAKTAAQEAIKEAETVINNENATPEQVTAALEKVNAKKAALQQAKDGLIEAATAEEKAKLKADAAQLTKADETGKTPNSIAAYEAEYEKLKTQLEEAKSAAAAVEAKGNNASKTEAQEAQAKVDAAKTALDKAAESLVNKADKAELTQAKEALNTLATEADPTTGKTADSAKAYNDAKTAAQEAIKEAETVIKDENATPEQVSAALEKVNAKKTALQQAKDGLIEAATAEEKAKLKTDAAQLTKADETGKTPDSIAAYEAEYEKLKTQLEEAKAAAAAVEAKGDNATKSEVQEAQAKVDAAKIALDKAAESLVNKADKAELTTAKEALNTLATAEDPTTGKTADSAKAYNDAKTAAQEAVKEAETVINNENATPEQVTVALNKVNEKKAALESAKQALVEAATAEEKAKLKADAAKLTKADETGKTPNSIAAYDAEYEKLKAQLEEAKAAAAVVEAKGDNATKDEVKAAQAKVDAVKTALDKAAELLVNKADKAELTKAKEALSGLTTEADPTTGKTADSAKAYNDAKTAAQEAIKEAEAVINDENVTPEKVTEALNKVNEKKAALEKAKQALVEAATAEEKAKLKADAAQLTKADETGKTPDSIAAYEAEYEKLKTQLEEAKAAAAAVEAKGDNATKAEAQEAQAKVDAAKTALDKAAESLKNLDRDAAKKEIADAAKKATDTIEASTSLTPEQKAEEKAKIAKEAKDATDAIDNATTESGINSAKENGKLAIEKEAAISVINAEKAAKEQEIDNNTKLSDDEKAAAKAAVAKAATEAVEAIKNADTKDAVEAAKTKGEAAIKAVNPVGKEKALEAIQTAAEAKLAEIDKNDKLSAKEKAAAKAEVAKAAIEAVEAIQKAETQDAVDAAQLKGETAIKAVNPIGKEKALEAIQTAAEAKLAEIDKNTNLSEKEKAAAKAEVAKAAIEAVEAIQKADTQEAVNDAQANGETAIKAVNPIGKEKALEAIKATKEAKLAEIEKDTTLSSEDKAAAKAAIEKAYNEAVEAIKKAETQEEVNAAQLKGEAAIKAVNTIGKEDVNEAKEAVKAAAAEKIASIKANPNLSTEEKEKAIAEVERLKQAALDAIDKATTKAALDKALRTFLYQLDQESLVYERPTFNLEAYIQASITGVVKVELGKAITQAEVISRLNLPENVTIISVDLPDTNTLGRKFAKVILRLPDGTEATVFVPVEVVESSEEYNQQNRQPNNTPVKPQEDAKPAEVPSDNSEKPAVNQPEDVKGNSSTTSQESKASNQKVLPNTGTGNEISIFGSAAMTVLASLGLVATSKKKEEE